MDTKKCLFCQKETTKNYCSRECYSKYYYQNNKDLVIERNKAYRSKNPMKVLEWRDNYTRNNKESITQYKREWRIANPDYRKECYKNNIQHRESEKIRSRTRNILIGKIKSDTKVKAFLGCTRQEFLDHLEGLFLKGMSWNNYGKDGWTLDHLTNLNRYDLTNPIEKIKAQSYKNIRPIWKTQNLSRSK